MHPDPRRRHPRFEYPGSAGVGPQQKRASSRVEAGTSGFLSISDSDRRVPAEFGQESQASSCVEEWNSACLTSCSRGDRPLVELYVEPAGFFGQCTGVSVPLRVVPSSTGLPSKRCPGIGFFSRVDREIGVFRHVAPPMRLRLEFPRETGLIVRCAGKVENPFQTKQGNQNTCRDQKGRRGSAEVMPGTPVFPSSETGVSGNYWGHIKGAKYHFALQDGTWDFSWDAVAGKGLILQ